jgi:leader peptidase (prepilin peptidase)/N-methyltransferase
VQEELFAALGAGTVTAVACWLGPRLIARIPEPTPDAEPGSSASTSAGTGPATDEESALADDPLATHISAAPPPAVTVKPLYADLAARPHLALVLALVGALTGGIVGLQIGWQPVLVAWVFLSVIGVLLGYVDAQTRLLPTWIIAPSYGVLLALLVVAGLVDGDGDALIRSGLGWLAIGGFYFVMWFIYPKGLGYGDVRLSGLLGLALGYLGWSQVLVGMYAGFLLGGVGGGLLSLVKVFDRKRYPFGPFMLLGALVGLVWGPAFGTWYLDR